MVFNEPEASLHPDLLPALGRLMLRYAAQNQLWVVSHARALCDAIIAEGTATHIELDKELGETFAHDQDLYSTPAWAWPKR